MVIPASIFCASLASLGVTIVTRMAGQIYKKLWLDVLEASFILNLGILAAATYHVSLAGESQGALSYLSVSIALVTFLGIILYHIYLQTHGATFWNSAGCQLLLLLMAMVTAQNLVEQKQSQTSTLTAITN